MEYVHYEYHVHQKPSIVNFTWPQPATLLGFDQTNPNETSLHAMRITTRNYTVVRRKRKKERKRSDLTRVTNLCSRRILHSRVQLSASLHENATPASCVEPMILVNFAPSRVVDRHREREREDGNEISTLWNSMGWFMTAISHQWRHAPHRLVEYYSPRDPLSHPSVHIHALCSFLLLSALFCGNGGEGRDNKWGGN